MTAGSSASGDSSPAQDVPPKHAEHFSQQQRECWRFFQFLERHADFPDLLVGTTRARQITIADFEQILRRLHYRQRYGTMTRAWRRAIDIGAMDAVATKGAVGGKPMSLAGQESGAAAKTRGGIRYREWAAFCHREGHEGNPRTAWEGFGPKNAVLTLRELAYHEYRLLTKFYLEVLFL
eukprot:g12410.t1